MALETDEYPINPEIQSQKNDKYLKEFIAELYGKNEIQEEQNSPVKITDENIFDFI